MSEDAKCIHLDDFLLQNVLSHLSGTDVCRAQEEVFRRFWGLQDVLNKPRKCSTYVTADLASFVRQHKCRRWETLASVAVQYNSDVVALRRLNNLMSDNALRSRLTVFVPVLDKEELHSQVAAFMFDPMCGRELIVVDTLASLPSLRPKAVVPRVTSSLDSAKLCSMLGRSLHIDEQTAKFYLDDAHGDLKRAYQLHRAPSLL